ncbi:MAG: putative GNAT family N-acyltransferase [Myxococcota bacterium]|jgi:predicted GNAT family N-acyltransferase
MSEVAQLSSRAVGWRGFFVSLRRWWRRQRHIPRVQLASPSDVVDLRHAVLRSGRPRESAVWSGDTDPETRHWTVTWAGEVVGVATVLARTEPTHPEHRWQLRGMATAQNVRGKGLGKALLLRLTTDVNEPMWCNARESAKPFYEGHGWECPGEAFDIPRIGPHYRMFSQL